MPHTYVKDAGIWKPLSAPYARDAGVWKPAHTIYAKDANVWKVAYAVPITSSFVYANTSGIDDAWYDTTIDLSGFSGDVLVVVAAVGRFGPYPNLISVAGKTAPRLASANGGSTYLSMHAVKVAGGASSVHVAMRWGGEQGYRARMIWGIRSNYLSETPIAIANVNGSDLAIATEPGGLVIAAAARGSATAISMTGLTHNDFAKGDGGSQPAYVRGGRIYDAPGGTADIKFAGANASVALSFR